jgi:hypothetical protein
MPVTAGVGSAVGLTGEVTSKISVSVAANIFAVPPNSYVVRWKTVPPLVSTVA